MTFFNFFFLYLGKGMNYRVFAASALRYNRRIEISCNTITRCNSFFVGRSWNQWRKKKKKKKNVLGEMLLTIVIWFLNLFPKKKKKKKPFWVTVWWWVVWRWLNHPMTLELVRPPPPAKYGVAEPPQASGSSTPWVKSRVAEPPVST
jgi:hypothetical protein